MNKTQKKCFLASAGVHLLLVTILFVGPAFLSGKNSQPDLPKLDFIPSILVDAAITGGGNPNVRPPASTPQAPTPPTIAPPARAEEPAKAEPKRIEPEPVKQIKNDTTDPDALEPAKPVKRTPQVSTKVETRKTSKTSKPNVDAEKAAEERRLADNRNRAVSALKGAAIALQAGQSGVTTVAIGEYGPGGGGPAYASYAAWVKTVFENAWEPPDDTSTENAITTVRVTIARDGTVTEKRIIKGSGDAPVDASVRRALDRVSTIGRPFPEGAKENERSYNLKFDLRAKRGLA